ncbi:tetratricopeptide repeat protein [Lentisalinibacter salinarum]|uniref:tetratricopeptide repeat protein n=1 Tax=Lentisalinibacter salinarum TaxID=2992239 RepID=UPI003868DF12
MAGRKFLAAAAALLLPAAAVTEQGPVTVEDPHYGEVLFHFYQQDYFTALVHLTAAEERGLVADHAAEAELLRGGLYLSYGQHEEASLIFERLLAESTDPSIRDRTWFFLAKIRFQRGYHRDAELALAEIRDALPEELEAERRMLAAQVLMGQERYPEVIDKLADWRGPGDWLAYARYNLGVALVRNGQLAEGAALLDEVGRTTADSEELRSLRDKANVALGYSYLQDERPEASRPVLERVRLQGPFSNKALLGTGWADSADAEFERALVPWLELRSRNLLDPAVQESLLAVPYAYGMLGANARAAEHYLGAIEAFEAESSRIDGAIERIRRGEMIDTLLAADPGDQMGWYWKLDALPATTENRYLLHLLASHEFQEALKNYRDLRFLQRNLLDWKDSVVVFDHMLETRGLAYASRLPRVEQALADADLDAIDQRRRELESRLNRIVEERDTLALATPREHDLWQEVRTLSATPALEADLPEARDAAAKLRLMRGVLAWDLDKHFKARVWRQRKNLRDLERALAEGRRSRQNVEQARVDGPQTLAGFRSRIDSLSPRIDALLARLADLADRQEAYLRRISVRELEAQKGRMATYTVQARFALASIYDRAAQLRETP